MGGTQKVVCNEYRLLKRLIGNPSFSKLETNSPKPEVNFKSLF